MILRVQDLQIGYKSPLVRQIRFELNKGDRVVLFGPNGSGKSTLLKSLIDPSLRQSGHVLWDVPLNEVAPITQEHNFNDQTPDYVEDYLLKSRLLYKPFCFKTSELKAEIRSLMQTLNLRNLPLSILSGGQKQKLKVARALLNEAQVLLLDEPLNAVDTASKREIFNLLKKIAPTTAQVWVLHDYFEIQQLQAPVLWIQEGQAELYSFSSWFKKVDQEFHSWMKPDTGKGLWTQV